MDPAALASHAALSPLLTTDQIATAFIPPLALGSPALSQQGKQINYDPTRAADGMLTFAITGQSSGFGQEWGEQLTAGKRTDTAATNGTSLDDSAGATTTPAVPGSGTPFANPSPINAQVVITGGTMTNVQVNGVSVGTGAGTYQVPGGALITLTYTVAPTWAWTYQTAFGAQGYLQLFAFAGTSVDVVVQHAPDNATWATLIDFGAQSAPNTAYRVAVATNPVNKWLRVITSGTFTNAVFAVQVTRNATAVVF